MDPWLESPDIFPDLHDRLIVCISESLNVVLPPPYFTAIASRIWIESSHRQTEPDVDILRPHSDQNGNSVPNVGNSVASQTVSAPLVVTVPMEQFRQTYVEMRYGPDGNRLVTAIEVLSRANKRSKSKGRRLYLRKQRELRSGRVNLVEVDLLRYGRHATAVPRSRLMEVAGQFDYHVSVSRAQHPEEYLVYPVRLEQALPTIEVPLLPEVKSVSLNFQALLARCWQSGQYDRRRIDYSQPPNPPLTPEQAAWAEAILKRSSS
jgi:hypothetical protein